ncbi:hypothetical protein [Dactylosporangium sp. CA-233914]|uniref:hypothetical protein n=1 Tax=Dactylosporangium sp. CA-233914 TaxID=3239934 RepID=UPI003D94F455
MRKASRGAAIEAILGRIEWTLTETEAGFPHYADTQTGRWVRSPGGDWTGGFWVGQLWLAAAARDSDALRSAASDWARQLEPRLRSHTVFRGFLFWYGCGTGAQLFGDPEANALAIEGALALRGLYNASAGLIPLGDDAEEATDTGMHNSNIDGVPGTVPLLVYAAANTGDESLRALAESHARRHCEILIRDDGSVIQSVSLDAKSGAPTRLYTHKGINNDSTWTRAQAWGLLGLAHSVRWLTDDLAPLARRVGDWWIDHLPKDAVTYWDFDAPHGAARDTSGTAIAAAALLKLASALPDRSTTYVAAAESMIAALVTRHLTPVSETDPRPPGILLNGCYNHRLGLATDNELIWGDYYLLESLLHLDGTIDATLL